MSRTTIYQLIRQDSSNSAPDALGGIGLLPENVYAAGIDTPRGELFVTIRFGLSDPGMGASKRTQVTVWAYDRDRDYLRIEAMLKRVRILLEGLEAARTAEGWITSVEWSGDSEDLYDDIYKASARNSTFMMIDSGR